MGTNMKELEMEDINMAKLLMMMMNSSPPVNHRDRVFECKTCKRRFSSFQALGGHRASHRKLRGLAGENDGLGGSSSKGRAHLCPICGIEFPIGQALGGHMRRHRQPTVLGIEMKKKKKVEKLNLDLCLGLSWDLD